MKTLELALKYAKDKHNGQRYGKKAYMYHINHVVRVAQQLGFSKNVQIACALHDILEDTKTYKIELTLKFGEKIADAVELVTNLKDSEGKTLKKETYEQIKGNYLATAVKLCDRIANVTASKSFSKSKRLFEKYFKEKDFFRKSIYSRKFVFSRKINRAWNILEHCYNNY